MNYNTRKYDKARAILIGVIAGVIISGAMFLAVSGTMAEDHNIVAYIICQPGDWVNARKAPSTRSESVARLETGDSFELDGRSKNGFMYAPVLACEYGEAWIYSGYIVTEQPQNACGKLYRITSNGRVACRRYIEGPRRCWVVDGSEVKVWGYTSEWAVTNKGFIQSRYIEGLIE